MASTVQLIFTFTLLLPSIVTDEAEILTSEMHDPYTRTTGA